MVNIDIIIDSHEEKLIEALESVQLKAECDHMMFEIGALEVGDIIYKYQDRMVCLIERKTNEDYASSIIDGRSKNQSIRISQLKKDFPDLIIIYLIEGDFLRKDHKFRNGLTRDRLYSSFINRVIRDQFTIYRTADIYDTALVVTKIYDKLLEHFIEKVPTGENVSARASPLEETKEYLKTIKLAKKDNMTPNNCYLCQLSQIPGVSIDTATVISDKYNSMRQLIMAYERCAGKDNMLAEIQIPIINKKSRRLGQVLSKRICEYIYGSPKKSLIMKKHT